MEGKVEKVGARVVGVSGWGKIRRRGLEVLEALLADGWHDDLGGEFLGRARALARVSVDDGFGGSLRWGGSGRVGEWRLGQGGLGNGGDVRGGGRGWRAETRGRARMKIVGGGRTRIERNVGVAGVFERHPPEGVARLEGEQVGLYAGHQGRGDFDPGTGGELHEMVAGDVDELVHLMGPFRIAAGSQRGVGISLLLTGWRLRGEGRGRNLHGPCQTPRPNHPRHGRWTCLARWSGDEATCCGNPAR